MIKTSFPQFVSVPIVKTIRSYSRSLLRHDVVAGVTVAAIAVPQAMAYSQLAGVPLTSGLYAALVAMVVFAVFTTTKAVMAGPDAALAALTGASLLPLLNGDPRHAVTLVALFSLLIGIASMVAIAGKLGFIGEFLSRPILLGYMAGLALAVIASQAPKLFGMSSVPRSNFFATIVHIASHLGSVHLPTICFSAALLLLGYVVIKYLPSVPVTLFLLVLSLLASWLFGLKNSGIAVVGVVPSGLPLPALPRFTMYDIQTLFVPALAVMMISYANTIATARSFASRSNDVIEPRQEFFALGVSNLASGLFGGMPVGASGARSAVAHQSNAATQMTQLFGALTIGLVLLFFAPLLRILPLASLAVIIIMAVSKLFDIDEMRSIWRAWRAEAGLVVITMLGVTILGIFQGLLLAVLLAIGNLIRSSAFPNDAVLGVAKNGAIRDMSRPPKTEKIEGIVMYRFDAPLYFGNANFFRERVLQLVEAEPSTRWFLWDAETITSIDSTGGAMLLGLIRELRARHVTFCIARLKGPIRRTISHTNRLSRAYQATPHFANMGDALEAFKLSENKAKKIGAVTVHATKSKSA